MASPKAAQNEEGKTNTEDTTLKLILEQIKPIQTINENVIQMKESIAHLTTSLQFTQGELDDLKKQSKEQQLELKEIQKKLDEMQLIKEENKQLKKKLVALEAYGRRENLIFTGIPEGEDDNCHQLILNLLKQNLGLEQADDIKF